MISPNSIVSFCLLDVSRAGLAFCYNGTEGEQWEGNECTLDFFGEDFSLENVPVQIIHDQPFDPDKLPDYFKEDLAPCLRRCGVRFLELSKEQADALEKYMDGLSTEGTPMVQPRAFEWG